MLSLVFSMGTWFVRFEGTDRSTLEDDMNCEKETTTDGDNRRRERENHITRLPSNPLFSRPIITREERG